MGMSSSSKPPVNNNVDTTEHVSLKTYGYHRDYRHASISLLTICRGGSFRLSIGPGYDMNCERGSLFRKAFGRGGMNR